MWLQTVKMMMLTQINPLQIQVRDQMQIWLVMIVLTQTKLQSK